MSDLSALTAEELSSGLREKKWSSVELTKACIEKAEKLKHLNCFIEFTPEVALTKAKDSDSRLAKGEHAPLLGVPVAIKDVLATKGVRTTCGSKMLENWIPPYNATVITKLDRTGAVSLGKLNMDEFAMGSSNENSAFGAVRNPWNPEYVPGGSSGGSAAAVAAGICPITLGTDTGGSIRQPASYCGVVGIKPTYGRVSRFGLVAFASSLDQIGPFAKTVKDAATMTSLLAGFDPNDGTSVKRPIPDFGKIMNKGIKGLKIGIPKEYFISGIDADVDNTVRAALRKLEELGATLVDVDLPHTELALSVYYIIAPAEASSNLARFDGVRYGFRAKEAKDLRDLYCKTRSQGFGKEVQRRILIGSYVLSSGYYDAYYLKAQKVRRLIANDFNQAFTKCDIIASPTAPTPAFKLGEKSSDPLKMYLNDIFTIPVNLAGLPGISVPCGFSGSGLPIGLQLIGKHWDEETLFSVGAAYQEQTEWHRKLPGA